MSGYWLYNRETGEPWRSCDPPHLIEYVESGRVQEYAVEKLRRRVIDLERKLAVGGSAEEPK
jgi:hypothetical protein